MMVSATNNRKMNIKEELTLTDGRRGGGVDIERKTSKKNAFCLYF